MNAVFCVSVCVLVVYGVRMAYACQTDTLMECVMSGNPDDMCG